MIVKVAPQGKVLTELTLNYPETTNNGSLNFEKMNEFRVSFTF